MPTISQNKRKFGDRSPDWDAAGENWSSPWGNSDNQWNVSLYPRLQPFLPASNILEIAPGYGRWTERLRRYCDSLTGVDLNENCVRVCRERFADDPRLTFIQNDGVSLAAIPDNSISLIFSFDSLVHCEADVIKEYFSQFPRILKPNGIAFIHHSNYGSLGSAFTRSLGHIPIIRHIAWRLNLAPRNGGWRAETVSAGFVRENCQGCGLHCISQEIIDWDSPQPTDCITIAAALTSSTPTRITETRNFWPL